MTAATPQRRPIGVTAKVIAILEAFTGMPPGDGGLTLTEICRRAGLPLATGHRLVGELTAGGFLERSADGAYRIGLRLWRIATRTPVAAGLRELALPHMEDLYAATQENVQLAVLREGRALYIERLRGPRSVPIVTRVGAELPLHATGVGKVLLAFADPARQEEIIAAGLPAHTAHTITDPDRLRTELAEVRRQGYALTREEMTLGSCSVAAPVRDGRCRVIAAISLVARSGATDPRRLAPTVLTAARALSRDIATAWPDIP
ncbi:IclR family transcriptional regulator [Thermomonospora cellulosilytica]|uniref:DNA-binding IclR family transcriptional regulator n=1 Tax=Thermomonospora cellulosilytica TaxID=1411118 RepID=A0A7W3RA82_9ACTN|nr:IclR family transcriptional regulator [Thermomonospora cellulosilytica]MBA9005567.1 DNA-binding IclR family transcriptional regulator [Thermomonospora cellulosilytica]